MFWCVHAQFSCFTNAVMSLCWFAYLSATVCWHSPHLLFSQLLEMFQFCRVAMAAGTPMIGEENDPEPLAVKLRPGTQRRCASASKEGGEIKKRAF